MPPALPQQQFWRERPLQTAAQISSPSQPCRPSNFLSECVAQVRQLLFAPTSYHMGLYPRLLLGGAAAPGDLSLPANKVQHIALGHMYLVHCKCWERMAPFIAAGGLR